MDICIYSRELKKTMADNITAAEVRLAGGWDAIEAPDATLESAAYIPAGDGWLNLKLGMTLAAYTIADTDGYKSALVKAAEIYYVAYLFTSRPPKEDFQAGPVKSGRVKGQESVTLADYLKKTSKEMLSQAGFKWEEWKFGYTGGGDYNPLGEEHVQVDIAIANNDGDYPFNTLGSDSD